MSVTVTNLVQGPGAVYIGAFGATEPADTAVNTTPPSSSWTDLGGTQDGIELAVNQEYKALEVDQVVDVPGRRLVSRDMTVKTNLAEPTLENLVYVLNDGTSASGSGYKSFEPIYASSATQPTYRALIVDGYAPGGDLTRRAILRKALSTDNAVTSYKKADQTFFTVTWSMHFVSASIAPFKFIDEVA